MSKIDQPEHRLSHYVDALLDRIMVEPCWYSAVDHGSPPSLGKSKDAARQETMVRAQRMKARGVKPSHLDWFIFQNGIYAQFELKYGSNKPDVRQEDTMRLLAARGIPTGCAWTLAEFYDLLIEAGFTLHANARNILTEIEAKHAASQDKAEMIKSGVIVKKKYAAKKVSPRYLWKISA